MNTGRCDAATSTDDMKGRPLCLFYFAHPFGVLSCEPPTVVAGDGAAAARARRLPPLQLRPRGVPAGAAAPAPPPPPPSDAWARCEPPALPPIEPPPPPPVPPLPRRLRRRSHRLGPVGIRKSGTRSRGALARLLRRTVNTSGGVFGGGGGEGGGDGVGVLAAVDAVRAAWQTPHTCNQPSPLPPQCKASGVRCTWSAGRSATGISDMEGSTGLLRRRYSVPETVMRRCKLSREEAEVERESSLLGGGYAAACECGAGSPAQRPAPLSPRPALHVLEVAVRTGGGTQPSALMPPTPSLCSAVDIDSYVAGILVDSLNSLSDRLESMTVSIGPDAAVAVLEKEIKVRLTNASADPSVAAHSTAEVQVGRDCDDNAASPPDRGVGPASPRRVSPRAEVPSPCISLVDSLDDPASPRAPPPPPRPSFVSGPSPRERSESFFIRITDDDWACERDTVAVAERMPERIRRRLHRRHRRREQRNQGARRGVARREVQRDVRRQCAALVDALVDEAVARVAREELQCARIARRRVSPAAFRPSPGPGRTSNPPRVAHLPTPLTRQPSPPPRQPSPPFASSPPRPPHPPSSPLPPALPPQRESRGSRRLYRKSEIHEGSERIEILEIVEFATGPSSSETASDESGGGGRARRSRIPVPVGERRAPVPPRRSPPELAFEPIPEERCAGAESGAESRAEEQQRRSSLADARPSKGSSSSRERSRSRRSVGTQWASPALGEPDDVVPQRARSSSECESPEERPLRGPPAARRRPRPIRRPPPGAAPPAAAPPPQLTDKSTEGWSLTLAGSGGAALPARLDLRLQFPSGKVVAASPNDFRRETGQSSGERTSSVGCGPNVAIRSNWSRACRSRGRRASDALPALALGAPPRRHLDSQGYCTRRRRRSTKGSRRVDPHVCASATPTLTPNRTHRTDTAGPSEVRTQGSLTVLGNAIVPKRRAAPPTASERDPVRRAAAAARARRDSNVTTSSTATTLRGPRLQLPSAIQ